MTIGHAEQPPAWCQALFRNREEFGVDNGESHLPLREFVGGSVGQVGFGGIVGLRFACLETLPVVTLLLASLSKVAPAIESWLRSSSATIGAQMMFQFAFGTFELILACWLVSRRYRRACWMVVLVFFLSAALYGSIQISMGNNTCRCFGYGTNRMMATGVAILCGSSLVILRREYFELATRRQSSLGFPVVASFGIIAAFLVFHSATGEWIGRIVRSERLDVKAARKQVPMDLFHGRVSCVSVEVLNQSIGEPAQLIGVSNDFGFVIFCAELPRTLLPGESAILTLQIRLHDFTDEDIVRNVRQWRSNPESSPIDNRWLASVVLRCSNKRVHVDRLPLEFVASNASRKEFQTYCDSMDSE